jgi:uncharacterized protein (TIGR03437 family)
MLYVSANQINFVMPTDELPGVVNVRVATEGLTGPETPVTLTSAAPGLFPQAGNGYVIATDARGHLLTASNPAHAGDIVVIYVTGLGMTSPNSVTGQVANVAAQLIAGNLAALRVTLNGTAVTYNPGPIFYAGLTPGCSGLYQLNLTLPNWVSADPEIEVFVGSAGSQTGLKLPVQ